MTLKYTFFKWALFFVILTGIILLFYTNYRAAVLSITHDEAVIHQLIIQYSRLEIFNYVISQDHMIHTWLMKFTSQQFQDNEYILRLPNLLGHLLYIIFSILLLVKLKNPHLLIAGFVLLNCNPYLLDFFSIARGYGLSLSIMMISIYFGFSFVLSRRTHLLILSFFFSILSVLTVITLLNFIIALGGTLALTMIFWWAQNKFKLKRDLLHISVIFLLVMVASLVLLYLKLGEPLNRLQTENFIYQTSQSNFYLETIRSIIYRSSYNYDQILVVDIGSYIFIAAFLLAFFIIAPMIIKKDYSFTGRLMFFSLMIFLIVVISTTLQNSLFDIRFLGNRTATFIAPLMVLFIVGFVDELSQLKTIRIPVIVLIYLAAALFLFNTAKNANLEKYLDWPYESSTKEMMHDLCEDAGHKPGKNYKMGIVWLYEPSINFYRFIWDIDWLEEVDRKGYIGDFDYFYVLEKDSVLTKDIFRDKIKVKSYKKSGMVLLKKEDFNEENTQ